MDGTLAVLFLVLSSGDAILNHCPKTGCLAPGPAERRLTLGLADVQFQNASIGSEAYLGYDLGRSYGPVQLTTGLSVNNLGDTWVGIGGKWEAQAGRWTVESTFMPGLHVRGSGPDLGALVEFRSGLALGYEFESGGRLTLSYDHRSNGDLVSTNPGMETWSVRYSIALR